jgi:hypothetical protein
MQVFHCRVTERVHQVVTELGVSFKAKWNSQIHTPAAFRSGTTYLFIYYIGYVVSKQWMKWMIVIGELG